ncbi:MAG TPA: hypothetical protein VKI17_13355, partial [Gemmataceae bacterium]|nr:hypothetical protein [Gemmataceae bacterium]
MIRLRSPLATPTRSATEGRLVPRSIPTRSASEGRCTARLRVGLVWPAAMVAILLLPLAVMAQGPKRSPEALVTEQVNQKMVKIFGSGGIRGI